MKVKIKSFNGELPYYLEMGKEYTFEKAGVSGGYIFQDDGSTDYILLNKCDHLNGGSWEIVKD